MRKVWYLDDDGLNLWTYNFETYYNNPSYPIAMVETADGEFVIHRIGEPALEEYMPYDYTEKRLGRVYKWFQHGVLHRPDGPAIEYSDQPTDARKYSWYIRGKHILVEEYGLPLDWNVWTDSDKAFFKLKFA